MTADAASRHRTIAVPVRGGDLRVGVWEAAPATEGAASAADAPAVLLVHGVTSSHLAWQFVAEAMPAVRLIAPDLRGRGRSSAVEGAAGLRAHADDLVAVLERQGLERVHVVGHSMGAFVAVALAAAHPERVAGLVLVDGGLPLDAPADLAADALVARILGPTATRLSMRFDDLPAYLAFWRVHPAFQGAWSPELDRYVAYDLVPDGDAFRPATTYAATVDDTVDLVAGADVDGALSAVGCPVLLVTVPRGLQDEEPGLYAPARLDALLAAHPRIEHVRVDGFNHYTIVLSAAGGDILARIITARIGAGASAVT